MNLSALDNLTNTVKMIQSAEKFLNLCADFIQEGTFTTILVKYFHVFNSKAVFFNIELGKFNFCFWIKLMAQTTLFNYLKLSKSPKKAEKWLTIILDVIPEVADVFKESHYLFNRFKEILEPYSEIFGIYETPNETDQEDKDEDSVYDPIRRTV